jgi:hypothetical protein
MVPPDPSPGASRPCTPRRKTCRPSGCTSDSPVRRSPACGPGRISTLRPAMAELIEGKTHIHCNGLWRTPKCKSNETAAATSATELMIGFLACELIALEGIFSLLQLEVLKRGSDHQVSISGADGTVARIDRILRKRRGERKGEPDSAAMAIASVGAGFIGWLRKEAHVAGWSAVTCSDKSWEFEILKQIGCLAMQ